jgi:hypothetical protein
MPHFRNDRSLAGVPALAGFKLRGGNAFDYAGFSLSSGEFNGDGYSDLILCDHVAGSGLRISFRPAGAARLCAHDVVITGNGAALSILNGATVKSYGDNITDGNSNPSGFTPPNLVKQ